MIKITAELLKDLRKAQCIVFRVNSDQTYQLELSVTTRKYDKDSNLVDFNEWQVIHKANDVSNWNALPQCCFVSQYKDITGWDALIKLLRKDDELHLRVFTNNSELLTEKGLVNDQLHASIYRKDKQYLNDLLLDYDITRPEYRSIRKR